ncbi:site-specific integrase [Streptomonospora sp. S1-112]|uniref:Site-specific integrase n=1 Tax=Streptomonospora mangrovi TaxID=2883123 RepID=A0A9X3NK39_9ACTN|nr:site-specific integrase [Streptomonospora mangrovi]MDA0564758.1 site-specific integrase [Streptomonospora mangrovi]
MHAVLRNALESATREAIIPCNVAKLVKVSPPRYVVNRGLNLVPPKTDDSSRIVPLPDLCVKALREHRNRQFAERSDAAPDWAENGLVFPSRRRTPLEPDDLRRNWEPLRRKAGLDGVRFHDPRHTCVTLLLNLDVPPEVVREILGHSDIGVTMAFYVHGWLNDRRRTLGRPPGRALE